MNCCVNTPQIPQTFYLVPRWREACPRILAKRTTASRQKIRAACRVAAPQERQIAASLGTPNTQHALPYGKSRRFSAPALNLDWFPYGRRTDHSEPLPESRLEL